MVSILSPYHRFKGLLKGKVLPRCGRKMAPSDSITSSLSSCFCFALLKRFVFLLSQSSFVVLLNMILLFFSVLFILFFIKIKIKKIEKSEKYKNNVCFVYIGTCIPWMAIEIKFSKLCISCTLDEHLYAQLSK